MKRPVLLCALVIAAWCVSASADIVYLDDGRKYEGTVTYDGDEVKVQTKMGLLTFPKAKVTRVEKVKMAADQYKEKAAALKADDAEGHYQLALWCRENRLPKEATAELEKTIAANRDHEGARAALNYVKIDDNWVKAKPGMVYIAGEWVKPEDAIEKGKALYKVEKYEDAYRAFDGATRSLKRDCDIAEAQFNLGMAAERLGKWNEAKAAYTGILDMKTNVDQKLAAEARKSVIDASPGGMYLVKEPTGKEDIFSLDNDKKDKQRKLAGLQPLSNPEVMDIALREKCTVFIEKGKDFLKQARDANTGSAEAEKKSLDLLDKAEEQFHGADRTVKDIARGFLVDCTKLRIEMVRKSFDVKAAAFDGRFARFNIMTDPKEQIRAAGPLAKELEELLKSLETMQALAGQYPDELAQQVAQYKVIRERIVQFKTRLSAFAGK